MPEKSIVRLFRTAANTVTDPGVLFGVGNTILELQTGGAAGIAFNVAATAICAALRLTAELAKGHQETRQLSHMSPWVPQWVENLCEPLGRRLEEASKNPRLPLGLAGVAQFSVAAAALCLAGPVAALIPLFFAAGNITAALKGEPLENMRKGIADFLIGKTVGSWAGKVLGSSALRKTGFVAWKVLTTSEFYYTAGLLMISAPLIAKALIAGAGVWALGRLLTGSNPKNALWRAAPFFLLAAGNLTGAALNFGQLRQVAEATGLFGIAYAVIPALQEHGGVFEAARAFFKHPRKTPSLSAGPG